MDNKYYKKFVSLFKSQKLYSQEIFDYLEQNTVRYNYKDKEYREKTGCYYEIGPGTKLEKISLVVPYIDSDETALINIHEFAHAIAVYKKLGKKYEHTIDREIIPMLLERIYAQDNEKLITFINELNKGIINSKNSNMHLALQIQDELYNEYLKGLNIDKRHTIQDKAKVLINKYKPQETKEKKNSAFTQW